MDTQPRVIGVEFRALGPLVVTHLGAELPLGGKKQRAVLAFLLLHANQVVSGDRLIDELWGENPPRSAAHTLHVYVSRLRKALHPPGESNGLLETRPGGYILHVDPHSLDLHRFEQLVDEGRRALQNGSPATAADRLTGALALWRGPALADIAPSSISAIEIERLNEQRLVAVEDRIEAELAIGRHAQLVPELESVVAQHPLRERPLGQLMLALYRCGRQADSLAVYRDARRRLNEELGLEPTKELQRLEAAILRQDDALDISAPAARSRETPGARATSSHNNAGTVTGEAVQAATTRTPRTTRSVMVAVGAVMVVAVTAVALVAVALRGPTDDPGVPNVEANTAIFIDPGSDAITARTRALGRPVGIASGAGGIWIADSGGEQVARLDRATYRVIDRIPVGQNPTDIAIAGDGVWVLDPDTRSVYEIDPDSGTVVARIPVGNGSAAIAAGAGGVWVADVLDGTVLKIDPYRARVVARLHAGLALTDLAAGFGSVWATSQDAGLLVRIDPDAAHVVETFAVGNGAGSIALTEGNVWVANPPDATITRVGTSEGTIRKIAVPDPGALTSVNDEIWVAEPNRLRISVVDATGLEVIRTIRLGTSPIGLSPIGTSVGVLTSPPPAAHRGGTLRVVAGDGLDSIDPGSAWSEVGWAITSLTNEGLVRYARAPGAAGAIIEPGLATDVPSPQAGGRVYVFHLRPSARYSTGAAVRPEDVRSALKRQYEAGTGLAAMGVPVAGSERCNRGRRGACDLSEGIKVDEDRGTITFHLSSPDPSFLHKLALPFGSPLPAHAPPIATERPLPATGPYAVERYTERAVMLVRNPHFRPSASTPQAGFPDRIHLELGLSRSRQSSMIESGAADVMLDSPPPKSLVRLTRTSPLRLHRYVLPQVLALFMNTRVPPFDDPAARRALNLAVDRDVVVHLAGGTRYARATCQILSPGLPGYRPYCPYTGGSDGGLWRRPDLDRARALVARSGTRGMSITLWTVANDDLKRRIGSYAVEVLDRLGYRARLRTYPSLHAYYARVGLGERRSQIGVFGWWADHPSGSALFPVLFACDSYKPADLYNMNPAGFCHRRLDARIRRAAELEQVDPTAAARLWDRVDRRVTRAAPWAPLVNVVGVDFVSDRAGNYQRNPAFGILLDRLWVK